MRITALLIAGISVPLAAGAHDYSYIEGGYVRIERSRADDGGIRIAGMAPLAPQLSLFGEYADTGDFDQLSVGGLFHMPLENRLDLVAGVSLEAVDVGANDDTGIGLRAGLRWLSPSRLFEFNPEIRYVDAFDDGVASLRVAGLANIATALNLQAALQLGDDDRLELGLRYDY